MKSFETSPKFDGFSKVKIVSGNDTVAETGDSTGRELELECSYGNETMAANILNSISGIAYQPFNVRGAFTNPALELGDGVSVNGIYSGVYKYSVSFGRQMSWDISADSDEELEHEFGYYSEDGGYVTYSSLKNGTAAINGAGLMDKTVQGDDKLVKGSVSGGGGGGAGSIAGGTIQKNDTVTSVQTSLGYANLAQSYNTGAAPAPSFWTSSLRLGGSGTQCGVGSISFVDGLGQTRTFSVVCPVSG